MKRYAVFCGTIFLALCVPLFAGGKRDVSLEAAQKKYAESDYISAIGSGTDRASAESNAKLALSQILGESIQAEQITTQYADSQGTEAATIASVINEKAKFEHITGIAIKETATDKKTGVTYALAVLDRAQSGNYYFAKVQEANAQITTLLSKARANKGTLASLGYTQQALTLATENEYTLDVLSVINPAQGRIAAVSYQSPQAVRTTQGELASVIRVGMHVQGESDEQQNRLQSAFAAALTELGATVVAADDETVTHALQAELVFSPAEAPDPAYQFVRYTVTAQLTEFSTHKVVPYSLSGREGHVTELQAKNRALLKIEAAIKTQWAASLCN